VYVPVEPGPEPAPKPEPKPEPTPEPTPKGEEIEDTADVLRLQMEKILQLQKRLLGEEPQCQQAIVDEMVENQFVELQAEKPLCQSVEADMEHRDEIVEAQAEEPLCQSVGAIAGEPAASITTDGTYQSDAAPAGAFAPDMPPSRLMPPKEPLFTVRTFDAEIPPLADYEDETPYIAESAIAESVIAESGVAEPEVTESEVTEPELAEPEVAEEEHQAAASPQDEQPAWQPDDQPDSTEGKTETTAETTGETERMTAAFSALEGQAERSIQAAGAAYQEAKELAEAYKTELQITREDHAHQLQQVRRGGLIAWAVAAVALMLICVGIWYTTRQTGQINLSHAQTVQTGQRLKEVKASLNDRDQRIGGLDNRVKYLTNEHLQLMNLLTQTKLNQADTAGQLSAFRTYSDRLASELLSVKAERDRLMAAEQQRLVHQAERTRAMAAENTRAKRIERSMTTRQSQIRAAQAANANRYDPAAQAAANRRMEELKKAMESGCQPQPLPPARPMPKDNTPQRLRP